MSGFVLGLELQLTKATDSRLVLNLNLLEVRVMSKVSLTFSGRVRFKPRMRPKSV